MENEQVMKTECENSSSSDETEVKLNIEDSEHKGTFENQEDKMEKKEIHIPVFDGEDYGMWKKRIIMYLKLKKCNEVIEREKREREDCNR